jgi:hypothetical protein
MVSMRKTMLFAAPAAVAVLLTLVSLASAFPPAPKTDCCAAGEACCDPASGCCFAARTALKADCCVLGLDCCYDGSPCCSGIDCCALGLDCCYDGSPCCATGKEKASCCDQPKTSGTRAKTCCAGK